MSTYIYAKNGKDLADIFESGNSGITTGYKTANGQDIGQLFAAGNSGINTGLIASNGKDLGSIFAEPAPAVYYLNVVNKTFSRLYVKSSTDDRSIGPGSQAFFPQTAGEVVTASGPYCRSSYSVPVVSSPSAGGSSSSHTFTMPENNLVATFS